MWIVFADFLSVGAYHSLQTILEKTEWFSRLFHWQVAQTQNAPVSQAGPQAPGLQGQATHLGGGMLQNPNMNNLMAGQNHMGKFIWNRFPNGFVRKYYKVTCRYKVSGPILVNEMTPGNVGPNGPMMQVPGNQPTILHQSINTINVPSVRVNILI